LLHNINQWMATISQLFYESLRYNSEVNNDLLSLFEIPEELTKTKCSGAIYRTKYTRRINPTATTEVFQRSLFEISEKLANI
jgi:hypothetical protein